MSRSFPRALLAVVVAVAGLVGFAPAAQAHPLGNFTINRYTGVVATGSRIYVHYVLDLAEIPTVQRGDEVRADGYGRTLAKSIDVEVDGHRRTLELVRERSALRPGAGGLKTLRYEAVYRASGAHGGRLSVRDTNFAERIGWREVVVTADHGASIAHSSAPTRSISDELRHYPKDLLKSPSDVTSARATWHAGAGAGVAPRLGRNDRGGEADHGKDGFTQLITRRDLGPVALLLALLVAMFWGAAHALSPGHGKAIIAGYIVGSRGRPRHAVVLGLTVTVTHTAGVFALGLVTLALSRWIVPEQLYPWLTLVSGLSIVLIGIAVLRGRLAHSHDHIGVDAETGATGHGHSHSHSHAHAHSHAHGRSHAAVSRDRLSVRSLVGVGMSAGLLPCPSALVVLLSAIALHRLAFGMLLIVAFSAGLAATISGIGMLAIFARSRFEQAGFDGRVVSALPQVSAIIITLVGCSIVARAVPQLS